jgi:hypothetical protein
MCISCGVPHALAPDLVGWTDEQQNQCIWKKQPGTQKELDQAVAVLNAQELDCHRYAGSDPAILKRISRDLCDCFLPSQATSKPEFLSNGSGIYFSFPAKGPSLFANLCKAEVENSCDVICRCAPFWFIMVL